MFTRFKRNVQRYPRTFVVMLALAVIDALISRLPNQGLTVAIGVAIDLVIAAVVYRLVVSRADRLALVLNVLDQFEGRVEPTSQCAIDCEECRINDDENLWNDEQGQDVAEYAVMLAVILAIAIGTIHLIGGNVNTVFSQIGSKLQ